MILSYKVNSFLFIRKIGLILNRTTLIQIIQIFLYSQWGFSPIDVIYKAKNKHIGIILNGNSSIVPVDFRFSVYFTLGS